MALIYLSTFCRLVLGFLFFYSALRKVLGFAAFTNSVARFRLVPPRLSRRAAFLVIVAESSVAGLMAVGGNLILVGFLLGVAQLSVFSMAILAVLARNIKTSCNCFGESAAEVSKHTLGRNLLLLVCAAVGLSARALGGQVEPALSLLSWSLLAGVALGFIVASLNIPLIVQFLAKGK